MAKGIKNLDVSILIDCYGNLLTEKQRYLIEYYYNDDLSLSEIAENEGITRQGVRDAIKRAETQLYDLENKLGFLEKQRRLNEFAGQIRDAAMEISEYNYRYGCSREINERAKAIYELAGELL